MLAPELPRRMKELDALLRLSARMRSEKPRRAPVVLSWLSTALSCRIPSKCSGSLSSTTLSHSKNDTQHRKQPSFSRHLRSLIVSSTSSARSSCPENEWSYRSEHRIRF
eukprot:2238707-Rhodomonas_salina.1